MIDNVWNLAIFFGPVGVNLGVLSLGIVVLVLAIIKKLRGKRTCLFEVSIMLFLVSFLYFTLHSRFLQSVFPISLPEMPLIDNNLTFKLCFNQSFDISDISSITIILVEEWHFFQEIWIKNFRIKENNVFCSFWFDSGNSIISNHIFSIWLQMDSWLYLKWSYIVDFVCFNSLRLFSSFLFRWCFI